MIYADPRAIDFSVPLARLNILTLPYMLPAAGVVAVYVSLHGGGAVAAALDGLVAKVALIVALLAGLIAHEALHGLAWTWAGRLQRGDIAYGFDRKALMPFAHARVTLTVRAYRIGLLTPAVALGLLPFLGAVALGNGLLLLFSAAMTGVAAGDFWVARRLHAVPAGWRVCDHATRGGFVAVPSGTTG